MSHPLNKISSSQILKKPSISRFLAIVGFAHNKTIVGKAH
ncbi:hypothetical protein [Klebsiella phage vB_KpnS-VAC51]|uniref:Uncharacterized protein n=1 Tax=Klebsiella phage vB_KpnS-VAC51 TaxID=2866698 RepID=A0AAE9C6S2_9CAUD|nr:hypothetical protein [Klebsiella phage vB_KpnS-VAC51]